MSQPDATPEIEVHRSDADTGAEAESVVVGERRRALGLAATLGVAIAAVVVGLVALDDDVAPPVADTDDAAPADVLAARERFAVDGATSALLAAELFVAEPGRETAAALLSSIGGVDALLVGTATGDFDVVTFDPTDPSHLLASRRSSYGVAENQAVNEEWFITEAGVTQRLFDPLRAHDVAHFTDDGGVAVWINSGNTDGFASRQVAVRAGDDEWLHGPIYASRSVIVDDTLFALTGSADYYSADRGFEALVADRGGDQHVLADGADWSWVDSPIAGLVVAYPVRGEVGTRVWDTATLEERPRHPFASQPFRRLDVSAEGSVAVALTDDGDLVPIDVDRRAIGDPFGALDDAGIDGPITVDETGRAAVTVSFDGTVTVWWVGDPRPLAVLGGDAGPARVVPEHRAPRASSAVGPEGERVAVRERATSSMGETRWQIYDTGLDLWLERACRLAGRSLTPGERLALGLGEGPGACA